MDGVHKPAAGAAIAAVAAVHAAVAGIAMGLGEDRWASLGSGACLLCCNWVLLSLLGQRRLSPAVLYLNVLAVFHLGLALPMALGIARGSAPAWTRSSAFEPALLLLMLAFGAFTVGAAIAARTPVRSNPSMPEREWHNWSLYYCGLAAGAAGVAALLWGVRELGFNRFMEATYFETYQLARTYDPRFFVTSMQLTPMGLYMALAAAPRSRLPATALAGLAWAATIFMLGYRGFALTPVAAGAAILSRRGVRMPRWVWAGGLIGVLLAIPVSRQLRDARLSERT